MNDAVFQATQRKRSVTGLWLLTALVIALVVAANAHLIYVATTSQPACVAHIRQGEGAAERGRFSAAQSSCSPVKQGAPS
ncbi:MAG TPA: hypothetical protein VID30_03835 [Bradyrhizobium sp.]|jgi:hypothetical protein